MAVVINEFEVVPAAEPQQQQAAVPESGGDQKPPSEHELERLVEHQMSRGERVWAH